MNFKALALGTVIGFMVALVPACGAPKCGPANCAGCCDSKNQCVKEPNNGLNTTCGRSGNTCADCQALGQACSTTSFTCAPLGTGGGTGGGAGGGGGAMCDGCRLPSGTCVPLASTTVTNCGSNGNACVTCVNQLCVSGACQDVDAGPMGNIGDPCTADTDCAAVPVSASEMQQGYRAYCKKTTLPGGDPYPNGYCTRRCYLQSQCGSTGGATNVCIYGLGSIGEAENFCMRGCTAPGTCRTADDYECFNWGSSTSPLPACWLNYPDGGPGEFDAGPGYNGYFGACTDDNSCGNPTLAYCIPEIFDGGATSYTGGQCVADCTLAQDDDFCGDGGTCIPSYLTNQVDNKGPFVAWECYEKCVVGGAATCRTGYVCQSLSSTGTDGMCEPNCNNAGYTCPGSRPTCNATTGLCQ